MSFSCRLADELYAHSDQMRRKSIALWLEEGPNASLTFDMYVCQTEIFKEQLGHIPCLPGTKPCPTLSTQRGTSRRRKGASLVAAPLANSLAGSRRLQCLWPSWWCLCRLPFAGRCHIFRWHCRRKQTTVRRGDRLGSIWLSQVDGRCPREPTVTGGCKSVLTRFVLHPTCQVTRNVTMTVVGFLPRPVPA